MDIEEILKNIIKDCYWDSKMSIEELKSILNSKDKREYRKLFSKIIYNSKDKLLALKIFSKDELKELFDTFEVTYNKEYITKHVKILQYILFNKKTYIKGLEWEKI